MNLWISIVLFLLSGLFLYLGIGNIVRVVIFSVIHCSDIVVNEIKRGSSRQVTVSYAAAVILTTLGLTLLGVSTAFLAAYLV